MIHNTYKVLAICFLIIIGCKTTSGPSDNTVISLVSEHIYNNVFDRLIFTTNNTINKTITVDTIWQASWAGINIDTIFISKKGQYNERENHYAMMLNIYYTRFNYKDKNKPYNKRDVLSCEVKFRKNDYGEWILLDPNWSVFDFKVEDIHL